jgi:hypothetical protein
MKAAFNILCLVFLLLLSVEVAAQRVRLTDTLSPQQVHSVDLAWQPYELAHAVNGILNDEGAALPPLKGFLPAVEIRLNVVDYVDQRVRIYLVLPGTIVADPSAGTLELSWEVTGDFLPGSVRLGQEALLFDGVLTEPVASGTFDFILIADSDGVPESFSIEPYYELEVSY